MLTKKDSEAYFEASQQFESIEYGIGDHDMAIEIARDRLYSHPIRTLVQEYIANAYDACIEARVDPSRIVITEPYPSTPVMKIRDFGPGLSPERVDTVFTKYFASTKRRSKKQAGFFGVGAKSAWAYKGCDSFTVISYYGGFKTVYIAHLGQSRRGTLTKVLHEESLEPKGVQIEIAIQAVDAEEFRSAIKRAVFLWPKKPFVSVSIPAPLYTGEGFRIYNKSDVPFLNDHVNVLAASDGLTPYEMPGFSFVDRRVLVIDLPMQQMGIAPSREAFSNQDLAKKAIAKVKDQVYHIIREAVFADNFKFISKIGFNLWGVGINTHYDTAIFGCEEYLTISIVKKRRQLQSFSIESGIPVSYKSSADVCLRLDENVLTGDKTKARSIWLRTKRALELNQEEYAVVIVVGRGGFVGPKRPIEHLYNNAVDVKSVVLPVRKRAPKGHIPVRFMVRGCSMDWIQGDSGSLSQLDPSVVKIYKSGQSTNVSLLNYLGYRVVSVPNPARLGEAQALGFETDGEFVGKFLKALSIEDLYLLALSSLSRDSLQVAERCSWYLTKYPEWPLKHIENEIKIAKKMENNERLTRIKSVVNHTRHPLPTVFSDIIKRLFPLCPSHIYRAQREDLVFYVTKKFEQLIINPTEDFNALLSLSEQFDSYQHAEPSVYPYQRGQKIQKGLEDPEGLYY